MIEKNTFKVKGKVQGIGYRFFVKSLAIDLNLNGWVKNDDNTNVSGIVEGEGEKISTFFMKLKNAHPLAIVDIIEINSTEENIEKGFYIKH